MKKKSSEEKKRWHLSSRTVTFFSLQKGSIRERSERTVRIQKASLRDACSAFADVRIEIDFNCHDQKVNIYPCNI